MGNNYDELLKQYHALLQENERLQSENDRLRILLKQSVRFVAPKVTSDSEKQGDTVLDQS